MSIHSHPDTIIIGAGLAGLAAAVALSSTGQRVALLERKPYIGGRAYSYPHPALDEVIDSQHVLLGCCTNLIDLCDLSGASQYIRWYDDIIFLEPETHAPATPDATPNAILTHPARRSRLGPGLLPAPGHSALSFLRADMLSLADKARIALGMAEFLRRYPASDAEAFSTWLQRTRQTPRAIRHFWEPLILATVNDTFDRCSTRYAGKVIHEVFLASPTGGRLGIPTQPLSEFYSAVSALAQQQGTDLHLRHSIDRIARLPSTPSGQTLWQTTASDGTQLTAPNLVLALPFEQTARLLATLPDDSLQRRSIQPLTEHFTHAPITTLHLWFDRPITDLHHAALLDTRIQWLFNKTLIRHHSHLPEQQIRPEQRIRHSERSQEPPHFAGGDKEPSGSQYLELVISGSFPELHQTREQIIGSALDELARFFPSVRQAIVLKSGVLKEARATFSVIPGLDQYRPVAEAPGDGLFLAGDWTRTDWPATMEGAVRSGRLAAEAVFASTGHSRNILTPDLAPTGLMAWLVP